MLSPLQLHPKFLFCRCGISPLFSSYVNLFFPSLSLVVLDHTMPRLPFFFFRRPSFLQGSQSLWRFRVQRSPVPPLLPCLFNSSGFFRSHFCPTDTRHLVWFAVRQSSPGQSIQESCKTPLFISGIAVRNMTLSLVDAQDHLMAPFVSWLL